MLNIVTSHAEQNGANRVLTIQLEIGRLRDFVPEWIQKYFDHLSKGTVAEGAVLNIEWIPAKLACSSCGEGREVDVQSLDDACCPSCGKDTCSLVSGTEYRVKNIGIV